MFCFALEFSIFGYSLPNCGCVPDIFCNKLCCIFLLTGTFSLVFFYFTSSIAQIGFLKQSVCSWNYFAKSPLFSDRHVDLSLENTSKTQALNTDIFNRVCVLT